MDSPLAPRNVAGKKRNKNKNIGCETRLNPVRRKVAVKIDRKNRGRRAAVAEFFEAAGKKFPLGLHFWLLLEAARPPFH